MSRKIFNAIKGPGEDLDYTFHWDDELNSTNPIDTISGSSWSTTDSAVLGPHAFDDDSTTTWISGGTIGDWCAIVNTVTTTEGRTHVKTLKLSIKEV